MPIRSQPYDPFGSTPSSQEPSQEEELQEPSYGQPAEEPPQEAESQDLNQGSGIHQRKSEFVKRFADTNVYSIEKEQDLTQEIPERAMPEEEVSHKNSWLIFMVAAIIGALFLFMASPLIETFAGSSSQLAESIKSYLSFSAPIVVIIAALAGTAGYFKFERVAWFLIGGFLLGAVTFFISTAFNPGKFNLGIYWIIIGSLLGGFVASTYEFFFLHKYKLHKELQPLFVIGMVAFLFGSIFLIRSSVSRNVELLSYQQVGKKVTFQLYEPAYLPDKFTEFDPKIIYENGQVSIYYGSDHYPPPPVIDFLTGIEFIQSEKVDSQYQNIDTGSSDVIFVDIDNSIARFTERRGRATLEWDEDQTHIVMNIYSNIPPRDIFKIARELQEVKTLR